ncbi:PqiC family protein [Pseudomonas sp. LS1212]|uniref:PqiC family protein n=1 Tax=Pseudomonas sp. LS1212 TaxID=2972478 RepID=UPI00215D29E0|nr:PqiC family protein [Pseudomonas sp. LS1212]UVJ41992.1 PqiC family protein [Pseudomonas sp. LS1212]
MPLSLKLPLLSVLLLLGACRSDPVHYHTLTPTQFGNAQQGASADIEIERITVPAQVDRTQIVVRQGNSGLAILETEWWGASLSDELQSALAEQLNSSVSPRKASLRVEVQRFDSVPGQYALVEAKWRLRSLGPGNTIKEMTCRTSLRTPAGATIDDLVAAHQNNVKRLADAISQASRGTGTACPSVQ